MRASSAGGHAGRRTRAGRGGGWSRAGWLTAAAAVGIGCSDGSAPRSPERPPEAAPPPSSSGPAPATGRPAVRWRLSGPLTLPAPGEEPLYRVTAVAVSGEGEIYVLDGGDRRVVVFDSAGRRVRAFGRAGQGPGELGSPGHLAALSDGSVAVGERLPPALHRFSAAGTHLGSLRLRPDGLASVRGADLRGGGLFADWGGPADPDDAEAGYLVRLHTPVVSAGGTRRELVVRVGPDGRGDAVLARWRRPIEQGPLPPLFSPRPSWAPAPARESLRGVVVARGDRYELRWYGPGGEAGRVVRRGVAAVPVTPAVRRRAVARFREAAVRGGAPPGMAEELAGSLRAAEVLPAVAGLWTDEVGRRLWVGRVGVPEDGLPAIVGYDVLDERGRAVASVRRPPGFDLLHVRGDRAYGRWTDDLGVPHLRVYRIKRLAPTR